MTIKKASATSGDDGLVPYHPAAAQAQPIPVEFPLEDQAEAAPCQRWTWPNQMVTIGHLSTYSGLAGKVAGSGKPMKRTTLALPFTNAGPPADAVVVSQLILGWLPRNPAGRRQLYMQRLSDGSVRRLYESEMKTPREVSRRRIFGRTGSDVTRLLYEVLYEDGTKEKLLVRQDPLLFDLKGGGVKTTPKLILFGIFADAKRDKLQRINDVDAGTGILVFDPNRNGISGETGLELFGDQTDVDGNGKPDGFANGFAALDALVRKAVHEGILDPEILAGNRLRTDSLAALQKAYGLKMKVGGFNLEAVSLVKAGIEEIALSQAAEERGREFDGQRNGISFQDGAMFLRADGSTGFYVNALLTAK